jgi:hypothetical protein
MGIASILLATTIAFGQTAVATEYETALKCRAYAPLYTPVLSRMLSSGQAQKFADYWVARADNLGNKAGRTPQQVYASTLAIELKADQVDGVLATCLETWGASKDRQAPL